MTERDDGEGPAGPGGGADGAAGLSWLPEGRRPPGWLGVTLRAATGLAAAAFAAALAWPAGRTALDGAGSAVLLAAPFLVTILAGAAYARRGRRRVAVLAAALLLVLTVGAWLGARGMGT